MDFPWYGAEVQSGPHTCRASSPRWSAARPHLARIVPLLRHTTTSCRNIVRHKPVEQGWRVLGRAQFQLRGGELRTKTPKINSLSAATPDELTWRAQKVEQPRARAKQRRRTSLGPCMPQYGPARTKIRTSANDRPTTSLPDASTRHLLTKACGIKRNFFFVARPSTEKILARTSTESVLTRSVCSGRKQISFQTGARTVRVIWARAEE